MNGTLIPYSMGELVGKGQKVTFGLISPGRPVVWDKTYDRDLVVCFVVLTSDVDTISEGMLVHWELVGRDRKAWQRVMRSRRKHIPQTGDILTFTGTTKYQAKISVTPLREATEEQAADLIDKLSQYRDQEIEAIKTHILESLKRNRQ